MVSFQRYNTLMNDVGWPQVHRPEDLSSASLNWDMARKDEWATELWNRCGLPNVKHYLAENRPYLTRTGVKEWLKAGHSIGLHTRTHPMCSRLSCDGIEEEIVSPAKELKQEFGLEHVAFSYPFGDRLPAQLEAHALRRAGVSCALGIRGFSMRLESSYEWERQPAEVSGANWETIRQGVVRSVVRNRSFFAQARRRVHKPALAS
jgi:peptidoglycan/xylan/chitin deacetylase (PgdA/CDA1 family)